MSSQDHVAAALADASLVLAVTAHLDELAADLLTAEAVPVRECERLLAWVGQGHVHRADEAMQRLRGSGSVQEAGQC